jgi:hypothetical protein
MSRLSAFKTSRPSGPSGPFGIELIKSKKHLTMEGLHKIVSIRAVMNNGLSAEAS